MKLNIQCSSLIYRAKRGMITSTISDEILIASYDACHPKWSRKEIRCAIRTEHGRKVIEGKYPPRSHDCMPPETEFANAFEDAQIDVERREKNANKRRTMQMWRNAVEHTWETRPMSEIHKLIDRQPKIMHSIIECEGERTCYN